MKAAFKKRNENTRMELRKSQNVIKKKQEKKKIVKEKTEDFVLSNLLPQIFHREAVKKSLDQVHDAKFDMMYKAMLAEKNQPMPEHAVARIKTMDELKPATL